MTSLTVLLALGQITRGERHRLPQGVIHRPLVGGGAIDQVPERPAAQLGPPEAGQPLGRGVGVERTAGPGVAVGTGDTASAGAARGPATTPVAVGRHASAPHAVLLVLDATVGQNALSQVEVFQKIAGVTGLAMTKLDGTARGGILVAVAAKYGLPVHFIGVGEGIDDLAPLSADDFARAIAGIE